MPYDWRKPNRLLALQIGDTVSDQIAFSAYSAHGGECDNVIVVLKLVTNLVKENTFGAEVNGLTQNSKGKLASALATFISVDTRRAMVTMRVLERYKEVHEMVLP